MQTNATRRQVRMMLGQWGGWMGMLDRLRREQRAAQAWAQEDPSETAQRLVAQIDREIEDLLRLRESLSEPMLRLSAPQQQALLLRYEKGLNWVQISLKMHCDERTARRFEERAVDELAKSIFAEPAED